MTKSTGYRRSADAPPPKGAKQGPRPRRRGRETRSELERRVSKVLARLRSAYPDAHCALDHRNAFQLLIATILSAQCTDARVNQVTPTLFARYPNALALAGAHQEDLERIILSTGFFRNKAKNLIAMAQALVAKHEGHVPRSMAALQALPGVGRKTANVVLGNAYGINEGITVDTHVGRLSRLLRLTRNEDPLKIEQDLMTLIPQQDWAMVSHLLIFHGRQVCIARRPKCSQCVLADLCPSADL